MRWLADTKIDFSLERATGDNTQCTLLESLNDSRKRKQEHIIPEIPKTLSCRTFSVSIYSLFDFSFQVHKYSCIIDLSVS